MGEALGATEGAGVTVGAEVMVDAGVTVLALLELADFLANWSSSVKDGCPSTNCSPIVLMTPSRVLDGVDDLKSGCDCKGGAGTLAKAEMKSWLESAGAVALLAETGAICSS